MAKKKSFTIEQIATALLEQNPELAQAMEDNAGNNYQVAAAAVKPIIRDIGTKVGSYVTVRDMAWALVNASNGTDTVPRLQLKL